MPSLTGTATAAMGVLQAIRRSNPTLVSPIGWPVEIEYGQFAATEAVCKVTIALRDLNRPGRNLSTVHFSLERHFVQSTVKYIYTVRDNQVTIVRDFPEIGHRFTTACQFVTNTYAHDDDFVVPVGTAREDEVELMQVSTSKLRQWVVYNPLQTTAVFS